MDDGDLEKLKIDRGTTPSAPAYGRRPLSASKKFALSALLVIITLLAATRWWNQGMEVETARVKRIFPSQAYTLLNATGYVVPQTRADVASKATGRLENLVVEEGSHVTKGQVIARLEDEDVIANRQQAQANVLVAEATLAEAQAELVESNLSLRRAKALVAKNFVARQTLDTEIARNGKARAAVRRAKAGIAAAQAALESARVAEEYTRIKAPFDGIILTKNADIGDVVAPFSSSVDSKAAVVSMADMETLEVEADVSESSLLKVDVGQPCEIELDALPQRKFRGKVNRIVPTVDRSKATVLVKVGFVDRDPRILPEMSAKVAFLSQPLSDQERKPIAAVTSSALVRKDEATIAFVMRQERVNRVAVVSGRTFDDYTEIEKGLETGDEVVVNPPENLKDGSRVRRAVP